jgi:hypothetical protein
MIRRLIIHILLAAILYPISIPAQAGMVLQPPDGPRVVESEYFGMHVRWGATTRYWPQARFHGWRVITGETSWSEIEPFKGRWNFRALDRAVARAESQGVEVLLTLGYPPRWAADRTHVSDWNPGHALAPESMQDWESYLRQVLSRYKGRIKFYELMNEPHFTEVDGWQSKVRFPVARMVEMARIASQVIREIDPGAKLVSMSPSGENTGIKRVDAFLKAGGGKYVDAIGFHFYSKNPEQMAKLITGLQAVLRANGQDHLDIWNTETGFYIDGPDKPHGGGGRPDSQPLYSPEAGAAVVSRALTLGAAAGLRRFYWYSWDIPTMALAYGRGKDINPAGRAYIKTERWLRGATIKECRTQNDQLWICTLNRGTRQARLVWNTAGPLDWVVPAEWQAHQLETLLGSAKAIPSLTRLQVDESPVLIVSDDQAWGLP